MTLKNPKHKKVALFPSPLHLCLSGHTPAPDLLPRLFDYQSLPRSLGLSGNLFLMYCDDDQKKMMGEGISKILGMFKVCDALKFNHGISLCLEDLEVVPRSEEERERERERERE
ncbi:hypothetical protein L6452_07467 [Arctium lappa]|uniref:Uncharacterized protein n=1 Tax=Arctium lappa TaxID=4217 RepID=A0ACB9ELS6_ARCLA|nr:hypothetical protein L6452_07467 [Arctium lappa]